MLESSATTVLAVIIAALMSLFMASTSSPYPVPESTLYRVYPPTFPDYGAPVLITHTPPERASVEDPLEQRARDMEKAREAAIRIEAEVREICETMEVLP